MAKGEVVIRIEYDAFPTAREAIRQAEAGGQNVAIRLGGKNLVLSRADADRLAALGSVFAYLCEHHGQIMTVPVND